MMRKRSKPGHGQRYQQFNLHPITVAALKKKGIETLFPIQVAALGPAQSGRDVVARAKTGTGKTLAFSLPIVEKFLREDEERNNRDDDGGARRRGARDKRPRCIVLAPTRELAQQVEREMYSLAPSFETLTVYGGAPIGPQESNYAEALILSLVRLGELWIC